MKTASDELLDELMGIMREAAAGEILPRFRSVSSDSIRAKTMADDIVTDADIASERMISERLKARLPGITIIGEEAVSDDASILSKLADAELAAVIDPVDGTWHFAHGTPMFGSILAIVSGGKTIAGIIHYPVLGDFLVARPGQGAWHVAADGSCTRLSVAPPSPVSEMHGFIPLHMFEPDMRRTGIPRFEVSAYHDMALLGLGIPHAGNGRDELLPQRKSQALGSCCRSPYTHGSWWLRRDPHWRGVSADDDGRLPADCSKREVVEPR